MTNKPSVKKKSRVNRAVLIVSCVLALLLTGVVLRAMWGPISLPFLSSWIRTTVQSPNIDAQIGSVKVDFSDLGKGTLVLSDSLISVNGPTSAEVLVPRVDIGIDLAAFFTGSLHARSITIKRPSAKVDIAPGQGALPNLENRIVALDKFSVIFAEELKRWNLQEVDIDNGAISIKSLGEEFQATGVDARLELLDDVSFSLSSSIAGRLGRWSWNLRRQVIPETGERQIEVDVSDVAVLDLLPTTFGDKAKVSAKTRLYGSGLARLDTTGNFIDSNFDFRTTSIETRMGETDVILDRILVNLQMQSGDPDIVVGRSHVVRGNSRVTFGGLISPPTIHGEQWGFALGSSETLIAPDDVKGSPVFLNNSNINGRYDPATTTLYLDSARALGPTVDVSAAGSAGLGEGGPYVAIAVQSSPLSATQVKQLWPIMIAPKTREWILKHVLAGRTNGINLTAVVGPGGFDGIDETDGWAGNDVTGTFSLEDVALRPMSTLPVVTGLSATGVIGDEKLTIEGKDGKFRLQDGNTVAVSGVTFEVFNLPRKGVKPAGVSVKLDGKADDLGVLVDAEPFHTLEKLDIVPIQLSGTGQVSIQASFPVGKKILVEDVDWQASVETKKFSSEAKIAGQIIKDADLSVTVDKTLFSAKGRGLLNGLKADIDISQPLDGTKDNLRQDVTIQTSAKGLKDLGIDISSFVQGPLRVSYEDNGGTKVYGLDLSAAKITLAPIGWEKPKGKKANARFRLVSSLQGKTIHNFSLISGDAEVRGNLKLDSRGKLILADFSKFNLSAGDDAKLSVQTRKNGVYQTVFSGSQFDGRSLLKTVFSSLSKPTLKSSKWDVDLTMNVKQVLGFKKVSVFAMDGTVSIRGGKPKNLRITGKTSGRNTFNVAMQGTSIGERMNISAADTGELLRFVDMFGRMRGGHGKINVEMPKKADWNGRFVVTDFSITDDSAIKALKNVKTTNTRSARSSQVYSAAVKSGEASFQKMQLDFTRSGNKVNINEGVLVGAILGGTIDGSANLSTQTLNLTGSFVPVYAINNLFAKLPIIGKALGGGSSGGGLFGVTYKLSGTFEKPKFNVNPVSAIAPGIFRQLFAYQ
ncbi:AsmA-like C-terminal region-containing protein [Flexibacterium corallicola]|uniref:AsmA-like C-terminal region-containing protein n=1 Tax=Flexibacterium corallicola TaxID=3037259 RepID=UPI00286F0183|nr:AsmA-like C-terminal region-containing protein [Pseudovibrio sp. M1P-2-3]